MAADMKSLPSSSPVQAALYVVLAMAVLGLTDNLVILVADESGLWQFHLVRSAIALPMVAGAALYWRQSLWPRRFWPVAIRSLLIALSMFCYFGALAFVPVASSAAGLFTAPIWVLLISVLALSAPISGWNILAVIGGFLGALLVLQPDVSALSPALVMPIAAGVLYALAALATRSYCADETTLALLVGFFVAILAFGLAGCAVLAIWPQPVPGGADGFLLRGWVPLPADQYVLLAVQSLGAVVGVGLITKGYLLAQAAFVSVFEYTLLIFGAAWGWLLWGQAMGVWGLAGIALIMLSGAVLARSTRRDGSASPTA